MAKKTQLDDLHDFAESLLKSRTAPAAPRQHQSQRAPAPVVQRSPGSFVKASGAGGILFDFGADTGWAMADNATRLLNQFADPVQEAIANDQRASIAKAFGEFTEMGEHAYAAKHSLGDVMHNQGVNPEWNKQLNKSLDQQVTEMVKAEGLGPQAGAGQVGEFNKSTMVVGTEQVVAQSETDAAVIEMMKSMDLSDMPETTEG